MKILIAVQDESLAAELAAFLKRYNCNETTEICLLHAVEPPLIGYSVDLESFERAKTVAANMISKMVLKMRQSLPHAQVTGLVVEGKAKDTILAEAKTQSANLIVIGSHGHTAIGRLLLGSVALDVIKVAPCSTLVLHKENHP